MIWRVGRRVPEANIDLGRLPEGRQRRIHDAFHLELRYNDLTTELDLRVTITGETATELAATVAAAVEAASQPGTMEAGKPAPASDDLRAEALRARGGIRTHTFTRNNDV